MSAPLKHPGLPETDVVCVAAAEQPELKQYLEQAGIGLIPTIASNMLENPISTHTDMLLLNYAEKKIISDKSQKLNCEVFNNLGYSIKTVNNIKSPYPDDSRLNFVVIDKTIICNLKIAEKSLNLIDDIGSYKIINVKQGYSKCSICVLGSEALITDDESIYNETKKHFDVLKVSKGSVRLKGYDYGFIGGCCGKIAKDKLLFNGDLRLHYDYKEITGFLYYHNIEYSMIENMPLTDIGGIIPLTEKSAELLP